MRHPIVRRPTVAQQRAELAEAAAQRAADREAEAVAWAAGAAQRAADREAEAACRAAWFASPAGLAEAARANQQVADPLPEWQDSGHRRSRDAGLDPRTSMGGHRD